MTNEEDVDREAKDHDDALLKEMLDRKPSPFTELFTATPDGPNAQLNPSLISQSGHLDDYFRVAREIAEGLPDDVPAIEMRLFPLLLNYRHAVELALKYALVNLVRRIRTDDATYQYQIPTHHKLGPLLDEVLRLHALAHPMLEKSTGAVDPPSTQAQGFIRELDVLDPSGMAFRYVHDKPKGTNPPARLIGKVTDIGVEALIAGMTHIEKELLWYISMIENSTDLWEQWTADMMADLGW
ncbi:MAG: hypothetical protein WC815_17760 [Vicinamibacterales bacterium]|jgi:hypothetical protein